MTTAAPSWTHCGQGAAPGDPYAGCTGVTVTAAGRCLAHTDPDYQSAYLASLSPGADVDLRGTTIDQSLLSRILTAVTDPTTQRPTLENATFDRVTFTGNASFGAVTFTGHASFDEATFTREASFDDATFSGEASFVEATFTEHAWFIRAAFSGKAGFDGATFTGSASFMGATFTEHAWFIRAAFCGGAGFDGVTFTRVAGFDGVTFTGDTSFGSVTFTGEALFDGVTFTGSAWFEGVTFTGNTSFDGVTFTAGAWFGAAVFEKTSVLGPLLCAKSLGLSGASFRAAVTIEIAAKAVVLRRTRWAQPATVWLRYADADLTDAVAEHPVTVAASPRPFITRRGITPTRPMDESVLAGMSTHQVRVTSLRGVDAAQLVLTDLDLSRCRFAGTVHLDQLRLEGDCRFAETPGGIHRRGLLPVRYTRRGMLAEEHHWRRSVAHTVAGWQVPPGRDGGDVVQPRALAAVYRALRKSHEDSRNEPGAADFYYGEMEMRRADPRTPPAERGLLAAYWALSGYGLRAARALAWLLLAITATMVAMMLWGLPQYDTPQVSTGTLTGRRISLATENPAPLNPTGPLGDRLTTGRFEKSLRVVVNSVIFRSSGQDLTTTGTYTEMASRLTEPVLLGLAVLAIRGRIKR